MFRLGWLKKDKTKSIGSYFGKKLSEPQILIAVLSILVLAAVMATAKQTVNTLRVPFLLSEATDENPLTQSELQTGSISKLLEQKVKDTDGDGLSDYDEQYVYQTSAYVEDSDSDGMSDGDEVKNNYDPTCPKGADCNTPTNINGGSTVNTSEVSGLGSLTPDQLRSLLIQQGMPAAEVAKLDDATLQQTFLETIGAEDGNYSNLLTGNEFTLTAAQIREMLLTQGVSKEEADKLTDSELTKMWQATVDQFRQIMATSTGS